MSPGRQNPVNLSANSDSTWKILPRTGWKALESEIQVEKWVSFKFQIFNPPSFGFPIFWFRTLREACRKNFHLVAPLKTSAVTRYDWKTAPVPPPLMISRFLYNFPRKPPTRTAGTDGRTPPVRTTRDGWMDKKSSYIFVCFTIFSHLLTFLIFLQCFCKVLAMFCYVFSMLCCAFVMFSYVLLCFCYFLYFFAMLCYVFVKFLYVLLCHYFFLICFCYVLLCLCYVLLCFCYTFICFAMFLLLFAMLCYVLLCLCYFLLVFVMFCYVLLCFAMFCYALLCFAMFCYVGYPVARYSVLEPVGHGAYGIVCAAHDADSKENCAIKKIDWAVS